MLYDNVPCKLNIRRLRYVTDRASRRERQATPEDAPRPPVEARTQRGQVPRRLPSKRPRLRCPAVPICPKAVCGGLFCDDSVSDNDTPVLPNGGRPTEILPGVRVPWSGEASRRLFLRPVTWGSSVEYRCAKRDLRRVSMSEATGIGVAWAEVWLH